MSAESVVRVPEDILAEKVRRHLLSAGAQPHDADETTRALMHASRHGVDSHGVRLAPYYVGKIRAGRIRTAPQRVLTSTGPCTAVLDADHGLAHAASYMAMQKAMDCARVSGIGAVGVRNSNHFGAAGAYAIEAAPHGLLGLATCNAEALVSLFGGKHAFHGTNPFAFAAPVPGRKPWLMDMATSSVPFNRVMLYRALGIPLPYGVAVDAAGETTCDAQKATCLHPLGGPEFGFKGAALAGLATLLSAVLTGAAFDPEIVPDSDPRSKEIPGNIGHFFLAINPQHFVGQAGYETAIARYVSAVETATPVDPARPTLVPGDREWAEAERRRATGIPVDPDTARALLI
jgi:ureidoglycolate dehydrogenase (NAD+)